MRREKEIQWVGSSFDDLLAFPDEVRWQAGFQLHKVQSGLEPADWKPFDIIGPGVKEIRIKDPSGAFRVIYVAKFEEAIYVLHCFRKQTQATAACDTNIVDTRYRSVLRERGVQR